MRQNDQARRIRRAFAAKSDLEAALKRRWDARLARLVKAGIYPATTDASDDLVFTKKNGTPLGSFRKRWDRALRDAKIADRVVRLKDGTEVSRSRSGMTPAAPR